MLFTNLINILSVKFITENVEQKQEHDNGLSLTPTMQKFPQIMLVLASGECNSFVENHKLAAPPNTLLLCCQICIAP